MIASLPGMSYTATKLPGHPDDAGLKPVLWHVVQQHVEEAAHLRHVRSVLLRAPHVDLFALSRLDERIAAHLDGMVVSATAARTLVLQELEPPSASNCFAAGALALLSGDAPLLEHLLAVAEAVPDAARGIASAMGWVEPALLRGVVRDLLASPHPARRIVGLQACALHRIDPGAALTQAVSDADTQLRAVALQAACALGRGDLVAAALDVLRAAASGSDAADGALATAAAALACRMGRATQAMTLLQRASALPGCDGVHALWMALSSAPADQGLQLARLWSSQARSDSSTLARRRAIQSAALIGDPRLVQWLIEQMTDAPLARLAGEAFTWITGADLAALDLETLTAPDLPEHPNDDPDDDRVALDEDDNLPWPDVAKVQRWWATNAGHWAAAAGPVFMGQPAQDASALLNTLRHGKQRQRRHAAWLLGLKSPRQPLFPVSAPFRRQSALLAGKAG